MKLKIIPFLSLLLFTGCTTYYISAGSLMRQINASKEVRENIHDGSILSSSGAGNVPGNNLKKIRCLDKNRDTVVLDVSYHVEVYFYKKDGTTGWSCLSHLLIKDSIITGSDRIGYPMLPIRMREVVKVELKK